ncbi:MAG: TIGR00268 family protein, partial [Methanosarcinales archaeon]|nr:TIGR00268 family protein [Methanosarcinales archaeon]
MEVNDKLQRLKDWLSGQDRILISYSGGLDSSLLARVASVVLGDRSVCVILDSPALPRGELLAAEETARDLGLRLRVEPFTFLVPTVARNAPDRCYHCKKATAEVLVRVAEEEGCACIADG